MIAASSILLLLPASQADPSGAAGAVTPPAVDQGAAVALRVSAPEYGSVTERKGAGLLTRGRSQGRAGSIPAASAASRSRVAKRGVVPALAYDRGQARRSVSSERSAAHLARESAANCTARRGLAYYRSRERMWLHKMGAGGVRRSEASTRPVRAACPRYLAKVARSRARAARVRFERWHHYHYAWREWLPAKWVRIARCETYLTWTWNSGTYQGAFGFHYGSWDAFAPYADRRARPYPGEAYQATPRQQYEVALAIWRRYGFSGWGCRGA